MGYDELITKMEEAAEAIKARAEQRDLKRAREGLVKDWRSIEGHAAPEQHKLALGEEDKAFLDIVRGKIAPLSVKTLVEDTTGRQLISPAIDAELHRSIAEQSIVRSLATVATTDKDRINVRSIGEVTAKYGVLERGAEIHEETPVPAEVMKYVEDISALAKFGIDMTSDSDYDLSAYIVESFARAVATLENEKFLFGGGHDVGEPEGICTCAQLLTDAVPTAAAGAITIEDALDCVYAVPAQYRKGSSWIVHSQTEMALRKLRFKTGETEEGGFLWSPSVIAGAPAQFLGFPIYTQDQMQDLSDVEGILAVFGNIRLGYKIYDRQGFTVDFLRELYREAGLYGAVLACRHAAFPIRPADKRIVLLKEAAA